MDSANIDKINRGNSVAPNGHYIVDAFNIDRTAVSGIAGIDTESASFHRPAAVAHYGGRVFWGGCAFMGFGDKIYFSPVLEDVEDAARCYQQQDPTAEDDSDLLPSDGGVIVIPGMGVLIKLYALGSQLLAFASNGIWQIGGSTGSGFAANDYSVRKVSTHAAAGPMSFVEAEGILFWWNVNGIYILQPNQVTQDYNAVSVSDGTIKTFIAAIPSPNIKYVKGAYNPEAQVIQWLFRSTAAQLSSDLFKYDRILNFRGSTQAFYPWKITTALELTGSPSISGIIATSGFGTADVDEAIVLLDGTVVVIDPDTL
jgi:hypothetical protein